MIKTLLFILILLLAILRQVSGTDWLLLFHFGAALVFVLTVLAVYLLARREGYGLVRRHHLHSRMKSGGALLRHVYPQVKLL